jgi:hypothetical protein
LAFWKQVASASAADGALITSTIAALSAGRVRKCVIVVPPFVVTLPQGRAAIGVSSSPAKT